MFGGGPAGMTVAHELSERGFRVDVYERHEVLGGKCRSFSYPDTGTKGRPDLPGSMGGHFFFGGYHNIGETLARIPTEDGGTVADRLTVGPKGIIATLVWRDAALNLAIPSARAAVTSLKTPRKALRAVIGVFKLGALFTASDFVLLASKFLALLTSGERRQLEQLEHLAFEDYLHSRRLSQEARRIRHFWAVSGIANVDGLSARVAARLLEQFVSVAATGPRTGLPHVLSLLDGPETERWFVPWTRYVETLGARFHLGHTLTRLDDADGRITGAFVIDRAGKETRVEADWFVVAVPHDKVAALISDDLVAIDPSLGRIKDVPLVEGCCLQIFLKRKATGLGTVFFNTTAEWETGNEVLTKAWQLDLTDYGDGTALDCVSFQIADTGWNKDPGLLYGKPAKDCTRKELIDEVLAHLRTHVPRGAEIFAPEEIHSVYVNPIHVGDDDSLAQGEPMFASSPGCLETQPHPVTAIPNLFLAGSYVRSSIGVDSMEAANETGKLAANAVIAAACAAIEPVQVTCYTPSRWLKPLRALDDRRYARGLPNLFDILSPAPQSTSPQS